MRARRTGISAQVIVVVIAVLVVAGSGVYILLVTSGLRLGTGSSSTLNSTCTSPEEGRQAPLNFTPSFSTYPEMSVHFNGTSGGPFDLRSEYRVVVFDAGMFKVNVTQTVSAFTVRYEAWVLKNGSVHSVLFNGQNFTGSAASTYFFAAMSAFVAGNVYSSPSFLDGFTAAAHVTAGQQHNATIGPTVLIVTDYTAKALPFGFAACGVSANLKALSLETGSAPGDQAPLITYLRLQGNFTSGNTTTTSDFSYRVTSITRA